MPKDSFEYAVVAWMILSVAILFLFYIVLKVPYQRKRRWHPIVIGVPFLALLGICYLTLPLQSTAFIAPALLIAWFAAFWQFNRLFTFCPMCGAMIGIGRSERCQKCGGSVATGK
jgi:hypothetical protein